MRNNESDEPPTPRDTGSTEITEFIDTDEKDSDSSIVDSIISEEDHIFANKELLKIGYVPEHDRIVGRDEEIKELTKRLRGAVHGYSPDNVLIYGKTGTGKSLVARHVTSRIKAQAEDIDVGVAYIDCDEDETETQAATALAMAMNEEEETGINIPEKGLSPSRYYKYLWDVIDQRFDVVIVILDEIDKMRSDNILMKLSRAEEAGKTDCTLGVVAISNKIRYIERLNERTKSSLQQKEMFFSPYDASQIREILWNREDAFKDDVLEDGVIQLCGAFAAQEHGDARKAIDALRTAGELAYENGAKNVTEDHMREAREAADKERIHEHIKNQTTQTKIVLLALANLSLRSREDWIKTREVYEEYKRIGEQIDSDTLSGRRIRDLLLEQEFYEILETRKKSKGVAGGVHRENKLESPEMVRETVLEDSRFDL